MNSIPSLSLADLQAAVAGEAVAIRARTRLEPAGGPGDKIFPPTYVKEGRSETKYAMETRVVDGRNVQTVLLDSVASQANRIEEALLEGWRRGELRFPVVGVDFTGVEELQDLGLITALQAPHRIADAILRDSLDDAGTPFRQTAIGRACTDARPNHATGMYQFCPTALIFGVWDSTGPKGGLGAKFQRCLVSEIVGFDAVPGVKTSSRLDPLAIEKDSARIFELQGDPSDWTPFESEAARDKASPRLFSRKKTEKKDADRGKPSGINHGNIAPSIDNQAGGVTISHAMHSVVLSLAGLRRLRFQQRADGTAIPAAERDTTENAARTALAALGLAGVVYQRQAGYDLRSRSLLVPAEPLSFEILGRDGGSRICSLEDPAALLAAAADAAARCGMGWQTAAVTLRPTPKLAHLVVRSRQMVAAGEVSEDE